MVLAHPLGQAGFAFFIASLCITCFGSTLEVALAVAYLLAQGYGWSWSEDLRPSKDGRFTSTYSLLLVLGAALMLAFGDPLKLTNISMVATAASLPFTVVPLLALMNDDDVMVKFANGRLMNGALIAISLLSVALFVSAVPLQILGGQ